MVFVEIAAAVRFVELPLAGLVVGPETSMGVPVFTPVYRTIPPTARTELVTRKR